VLQKEALHCQVHHQVLVPVQNLIQVLVLDQVLERVLVKVRLLTRPLVVAKVLVVKQMKNSH